jgi:hypothetical protein
MAFKLPSLRNVAIAFIASFFGFQILSLIVSTLFPSVPLFQGGSAILIMLLAVAIISLFILGLRYDELKKENLIFVILVFGLTIAGYYYLPQYFPQLFSISPEVAASVKQTVGIIFGGLG